MKWNLICHLAAIFLISLFAGTTFSQACFNANVRNKKRRDRARMYDCESDCKDADKVYFLVFNSCDLKRNNFTLETLHRLRISSFLCQIKWILNQISNVCLLPHFSLVLSITHWYRVMQARALKWKKTIFLRDLWIFYHCRHLSAIMMIASWFLKYASWEIWYSFTIDPSTPPAILHETFLLAIDIAKAFSFLFIYGTFFHFIWRFYIFHFSRFNLFSCFSSSAPLLWQ